MHAGVELVEPHPAVVQWVMGQSRLYARLKRDHPVIAQRLAAGEFNGSAKAAARACFQTRRRSSSGVDFLRKPAWMAAALAER